MNVAGFQDTVAWQALHSPLVGMWLTPLPVALVPSWQPAQVPVTWVWSTRVAGFQVATAWQDSHVLLLAMCVVDLPVALTPSWQLAQLFVMPVWSKRAGSQASGEWQLSQALSLGM